MVIEVSGTKLISDFGSLLIILIVDIVVDHHPFVVERGFFPNDETLMHPLKKETVNWSLLLGLTSSIPVLVIIFVEGLLYLSERNNVKVYLSETYFIPSVFYGILQRIHIHWLIMLLTFFITDVIKFRVGRLRPHFLAACDPDLSSLNFSTAFVDNSTVCRGLPSAIMTARQSFPSGHSSNSMAAATSLIIYLHVRLWDYMSNLRFILQAISLGLLSLVIYVASSRLVDYWHHPLDIAGGLIIGFIIPILVYYTQTNYFKRSANMTRDDSQANLINTTQ